MNQKKDKEEKTREDIQDLFIDVRQRFINHEEFFKRFKILTQKRYREHRNDVIENYDRAMRGI